MIVMGKIEIVPNHRIQTNGRNFDFREPMYSWVPLWHDLIQHNIWYSTAVIKSDLNSIFNLTKVATDLPYGHRWVMGRLF